MSIKFAPLYVLCAVIGSVTSALAEETVYRGPFYMCPDAHGAEQKALFRLIDIVTSRCESKEEGLRELTVMVPKF